MFVTDQPVPTPPDFRDLAAMVAEHASRHPSALAVVDGKRRIDYATLDALADRIAASLQRDTVLPQSSIAICAASCVEYLALFLGTLRVGVAVAPLAQVQPRLS